jgi:U3 small nucleolar RNA-associated protein 20
MLHEIFCDKLTFIYRALDESDPDIQAKALDCILNWKDDFLMPYSQNLKNLINLKTLREELTTWSVSHDSVSIQKCHRSRVVPLVIRLLTPKVMKLKLLGSRKVCMLADCLGA